MVVPFSWPLGKGTNPWYNAESFDAIELLLSIKSVRTTINARNCRGQTALYWAVIAACPVEVVKLLEAGADPTVKVEGKTLSEVERPDHIDEDEIEDEIDEIKSLLKVSIFKAGAIVVIVYVDGGTMDRSL